MVLQFRVTELKELLNFFGDDGQGKKEALQKKALDLLIACPGAVHLKIKEMYNSRM
jgi:hypothetical protein